jgi:hypothetical protein
MASLNTCYGRDASLLGGSAAVTRSRSSAARALDVCSAETSAETSASFVSVTRRRTLLWDLQRGDDLERLVTDGGGCPFRLGVGGRREHHGQDVHRARDGDDELPVAVALGRHVPELAQRGEELRVWRR